jgi:hypothetical protein
VKVESKVRFNWTVRVIKNHRLGRAPVFGSRPIPDLVTAGKRRSRRLNGFDQSLISITTTLKSAHEQLLDVVFLFNR